MLLPLWWTTETRKASLLQWKTCGIRCGILFEGALRHPTGWDMCRLLQIAPHDDRPTSANPMPQRLHRPHPPFTQDPRAPWGVQSVAAVHRSHPRFGWSHHLGTCRVSEKQWESWETSCYRADKNHLRFFAQDFSALLHPNSDLKEDSSFWWTRYRGRGWMQRLPAWRSNPTARHGVRLAMISTPRSNKPRSNQIGHRYAIYIYIHIKLCLGLYKVLTRGSASNISKYESMGKRKTILQSSERRNPLLGLHTLGT